MGKIKSAKIKGEKKTQAKKTQSKKKGKVRYNKARVLGVARGSACSSRRKKKGSYVVIKKKARAPRTKIVRCSGKGGSIGKKNDIMVVKKSRRGA